jgi:hypothetical protein
MAFASLPLSPTLGGNSETRSGRRGDEASGSLGVRHGDVGGRQPGVEPRRSGVGLRLTPPGGVNVLGRERLGPFEVTRLAADDPTALAKWPSQHGCPNPPGLQRNLAPYVADRWQLVAIKLAPADANGKLTGQLQPLTLSFDSDEVVYPMRLSRSAKQPLTIDLYVLASHRMNPTAIPVARDEPTLDFAGPLDPADTGPALRPYLAKGAFVSRWTNFLAQPELIDGDYVFSRAVADTPYQRVIYVTRNHGELTGAILVVAVGFGAVVLALTVKNRRRRAAVRELPSRYP